MDKAKKLKEIIVRSTEGQTQSEKAVSYRRGLEEMKRCLANSVCGST